MFSKVLLSRYETDYNRNYSSTIKLFELARFNLVVKRLRQYLTYQ